MRIDSVRAPVTSIPELRHPLPAGTNGQEISQAEKGAQTEATGSQKGREGRPPHVGHQAVHYSAKRLRGGHAPATRRADESNTDAGPREADHGHPRTNAIELTPFAYQTVVEAIEAADKVQIKKMNPTGGSNLRYRIEIAAAFLAHVMDHAYDAGLATSTDPKELVNLALNLAIRRAEEIYGQDGA
jgi:hypothetical protein